MNLKTLTSDLPRDRSDAAIYSEPPATDRAPKILVADDDQNILCAMTTVFARAGFSVTIAFDGEEAWETLHHENYDLLVTDNEMPGLTGINLIKRMRNAGMDIPVILVSGSFSENTAQDNSQLRIAAMIPKPFEPWEFLSIVRNALQMSDAVGKTKPGSLVNASMPVSPLQKKAKRVLIADDDSTVRGSLAAVLESEGYLVNEASNGTEAVNRATKQTPDLVLLDLNMPDADGWTAFNQLDRVTPLLPVIVITARPNQYQEAVRVGVDAFMEKPLNISVLVRAIKQLTSEDEDRHVRRITDHAFVTKLLDSDYSCRPNIF